MSTEQLMDRQHGLNGMASSSSDPALSKHLLAKGTLVRFTAAFLVAMARQKGRADRFDGRIGEVVGYRGGAVHPIVDFPNYGRKKEVRLIDVDTRDLEVVLVE